MIIQHAIGAIQKTAEYLGLGYIADYLSAAIITADPSVHESTGELDKVQATTGTLDRVLTSTGELDRVQNTTGVY